MGFGAGFGLIAPASLALHDIDRRSGAAAPMPGRLVALVSFHCFNAMAATNSLFIQSVTGAAAVTPQDVPESDAPGIIELGTGTTTTGRACIATDGVNGAAKSFCTADNLNYRYSSRFRLADLSTVGEEYDFWSGITDRASGMTPSAYGAGINYDRETNVNFRAYSDDGGANRDDDTGVAAAADVWIRYRVEVYGSTAIKHYINNVLVATQAGLTAGRVVGAVTGLLKSAGTTSSVCDIDYVEVEIRETS